MKVVTTRNVYTGEAMDLCAAHRGENGHDQVERGLHRGECDICAAQFAAASAKKEKYAQARRAAEIAAARVAAALTELEFAPLAPDERRVLRDERMGLQAAVQRGAPTVALQNRIRQATEVAKTWGHQLG